MFLALYPEIYRVGSGDMTKIQVYYIILIMDYNSDFSRYNYIIWLDGHLVPEANYLIKKKTKKLHNYSLQKRFFFL